MKRSFLVVVLLLVVFTVSCSQHLGNFSVISSSTFRGENIKASNLVEKNAVGKTQTLLIFGLIPVSGQPKIDQAVAEALRKYNGDVMTNASLYSTNQYYILFSTYGYKIEGAVYNTSK